MSTYNGEKYITEQINSILNQKGVIVSLIIRDDGSTDSTTSIISKLALEDKRIYLYTGANMGFEHSFMDTITRCGVTDYYAYSDQDDVWNQDRLFNAIQMIKKEGDIPVLYGSNFYITDSRLNVQRCLYNDKSFAKASKKMMRFGAFGENMFACTMIWNNQLQEKLSSHLPCCRLSHDVWTQLLTEYVGGKIIFDERPTIHHRIHNSNTAGISRNPFLRLKKAINIYVKNGDSKNCAVNEIAEHFYEGDSLKENRPLFHKTFFLVKDYTISPKRKFQLIFSSMFFCKSFFHYFFDSYLVFINRY